MADSTSHPIKPKKPPTFQHYPTNRAKALKKAWVEKQKIKSKWKAEKRKEGLGSRSKIELPEYEHEEYLNADQPKGPSDSLDVVDAETPITHAAERDAEPRKPHLHPSRAHLHPGRLTKRSASPKSDPSLRPIKRPKISKEDEAKHSTEREQPSLRDLTREAYSRSTLHTFKSDPLKKKRLMSEQGGKDTHGKRQRGVTGRGQPNMKLRMNAMLQKIKQDLA